MTAAWPASRSLTALGLNDDALSAPLTYPGLLPASSGVLVDGHFLKLQDGPTPLSGWVVDLPGAPVGLDEFLQQQGGQDIAHRQPVLAVGSNGSPGQLARKYRELPRPLPMVFATVSGLKIGVSAHINRHGYLPATPTLDADATARLVVLWLDEEQIAVLDRTEPNYHRVRMPSSACKIVLDGGHTLTACAGYVSKHGCVRSRHGEPWMLEDQRTLIMRILTDVPQLRELAGNSPEDWIALTQAESVRLAFQTVLRAEGMILSQPGLDE